VAYRSRVAHVLLVEDDPTIRTALLRGLGERGHAVDSSPTALAGLEHAVTHRPDIVVLDLGLPDLEGTTMLRMLRDVSRVPVIVATARDDEAGIISVLDAGADDYLVKPFSAAQLDARIRAVLRRGGTAGPSTEVVVGGLRIELRSRQATLDGADLALTPREFTLLHYLASRAGEVVSKRELLTEVWQLPYGGADKTVDVHLSWLRRKLGETAQHPRYLHAVRGVGVRIAAPPIPAAEA
jgi:DNA-binding response OmpR family regulator